MTSEIKNDIISNSEEVKFREVNVASNFLPDTTDDVKNIKSKWPILEKSAENGTGIPQIWKKGITEIDDSEFPVIKRVKLESKKVGIRKDDARKDELVMNNPQIE